MYSKPRVYNLKSIALIIENNHRPSIKKNICMTLGNKKLRLHNYVLLTSEAMVISKYERKTKGNDQIRQREKPSVAMTPKSEALNLSSGFHE